MREFLNMGGYAVYVWSAFGLTAVVLIWNWVDARRRFQRALRTTRARRAGDGGSSG